MSAARSGQYWRIRGFDSSVEIYRRDVPESHLGRHQVQSLLMALATKAGLDLDEIVGAYVAQNASIRNDLLVVRSDGPFLRLSSGENPFFTVEFVNSGIDHE